MDTAPVWVGIDVAKEQLDVALGAEGSTLSVPNDEAGIRALLVELREPTCALVVLEATGGFEVPAVSALAAAGLPVVVVNPRQVRNFARAIGQLAKTDAWMRASWRPSPSGSGPRCEPCPTMLHACSKACLPDGVS